MKRKMLRNLAEVIRDEMYMQEKISDVLKSGLKTIPAIAQELGQPSPEVTMWLMAMRRFGKVVELPKSRAEDYYQYKLVEDK